MSESEFAFNELEKSEENSKLRFVIKDLSETEKERFIEEFKRLLGVKDDKRLSIKELKKKLENEGRELISNLPHEFILGISLSKENTPSIIQRAAEVFLRDGDLDLFKKILIAIKLYTLEGRRPEFKARSIARFVSSDDFKMTLESIGKKLGNLERGSKAILSLYSAKFEVKSDEYGKITVERITNKRRGN